ncbi:hypothetical protein [Trebonia sp.]|uniref:hypothetical protein n=1 Tax=Trebonia sp. TaxID=2767075 RepID=UPI0026158514|nr:hypothetical protein [Trebonia sp.]
MHTAQDDDNGGGGGIGEQVRGWFAGRLPDEWFTGPPEVVVDREEITVVGTLPAPASASAASEAASAAGAERAAGAAGAAEAERAAAAEGRIKRFREETRARRIDIAREAEHRFRRKVAWGVRCGDRGEMFTTLSVPVMTRLRQSERRVLDTLVDAGVARSRSDALAWCVRLTGEHSDAWLTELREALRRVEEVRSQGPGGSTAGNAGAAAGAAGDVAS